MAAVGAPGRVPVAVALRVLKLLRQVYYQRLAGPVSQRDWDDFHLIDKLYGINEGDRTLGYRFLTDELDLQNALLVGENRVHRLCRIAGITASHHKKRSKASSTGHPTEHESWILVKAVFRPKAQALHHARPEFLDQHIRVLDEIDHDHDAVRVPQVDPDRSPAPDLQVVEGTRLMV